MTGISTPQDYAPERHDDLGRLTLIGSRLYDDLVTLYPDLDAGIVPREDGSHVMVYDRPQTPEGRNDCWSLEPAPTGWAFCDVAANTTLVWAPGIEDAAALAWSHMASTYLQAFSTRRRPWKSTRARTAPSGRPTSTSLGSVAASP